MCDLYLTDVDDDLDFDTEDWGDVVNPYSGDEDDESGIECNTTTSVTRSSSHQEASPVHNDEKLSDEVNSSHELSNLDDLLEQCGAVKKEEESDFTFPTFGKDLDDDSTDHERSPRKGEKALSKFRSFWKAKSGYGSNFRVMTGEFLFTSKIVPSTETLRNSEYIENLYEYPENDIETELIGQECLQYGYTYDLDKSGFTWNIQSRASALDILSTFDIQSTVCAAMNSKDTLLWLIGVCADGTVEGCSMDRCKRDIFRQAFDFCVSSEFVPKLNPEYTNLRFIKVNGPGEDKFVVEMSVVKVVNTLYQLSSGRIYFNDNGHVSPLNSLDEARVLLERKSLCKEKDLLTVISPSTSTGFMKYDNVIAPCALVVCGLFVLKRLFGLVSFL